MANELLSVPVACGSIAAAAGAVGVVCRQVKERVTPDKFALMGVLGAFVFAAQMVNFQLPLMPGTSGHMVGAVLLAIILGAAPAVVVMTSIVIVQCLLFQDGGLLALGCNVINMAVVPCFAGAAIYKVLLRLPVGRYTRQIAIMIAALATIELGAVLVAIEAGLSGVLIVPFKTFILTMLGVHAIIGIIEGVLTCSVLAFLGRVRPSVFGQSHRRDRVGRRGVLVTLGISAAAIGAVLSVFASGMPDGLEWSYLERPDQPGFEPAVRNESTVTAGADEMQQKYTPMPEYSKRQGEWGSASAGEASSAGAGWTSFAAVAGSAVTMIIIYLVTAVLRKKPLPARV